MISIVIPAFNEEKRIASSLEKLVRFLKTREEVFEVIVVDDASTDHTKKVAESFQDKIANLKVLRLEKSPYAGKGLAVHTGILEARGEVVIFTDADFSTPIEEIDKLLEKLSSGHDIAIGSRALDRSLVKQHQPFYRELIGRGGNILIRLITVKGLVDTQCGFKAFKMPACRSLFESERIFDFGFDVELLFLARKKGLKIAEVPVLWYNDPYSTVHPIKDSIKTFTDLFKIRLYHASKDGPITDKFFYYLYTYRTFWRFSIVGLSNTIVDFSLFFILIRFAHRDPLTANPISVETAIIWSFVWNNIWTFSERKVSQSLFVRFLVFQFVSLGGLAISQITLLILNKFFNIFDLLAKLLTIPLFLAFNYLFNSRWTFRDTSAGRAKWYWYAILIIILFAIYLGLVNLFPSSLHR